MNFKVVLIGIFLLKSLQVSSQTSTDVFIEQIVESVTESNAEDFDYSDLVERLEYLRKHPLNLNYASSEQLAELIFISPLQANAIISYRNTNGKFLDVLELQSVDALDAETLRRLALFSTISEAVDLKRMRFLERGSSEIFLTYGQVLESQKGYKFTEDGGGSRYTGDPKRILTRYRYRGDMLSAAITMEKDAGEPFFGGADIGGFDFYSGSVSLKTAGLIKRLVVGDYSLQFGQGLTMWSGLGFGKGAAVASIPKSDVGLKPYTSTNEVLFLRGFASTLHFRNIDITSFISHRYIDGNLELSDEGKQISSLSISGLHRTQTEIDNKNAIGQLVYGTNIQYVGRGVRIGAVGYQTRFNHRFELKQEPYQAFNFTGNKLVNVGAYYNYTWSNLYLFGETAHSVNSGFAFLHGMLASLTPKVSLILFHRDYQKDYHSFFNQAVSEGTNAVNEKGLYSGLVISPDRKTEFNVYADVFKFPWLRFRADAPSSGYEVLAQFSHSFSKKIKVTCRYKIENKEENGVSGNVLNHLANVKKENYRLESGFSLSKNLQLRNRIELVSYKKDQEAELGSLIFQDVLYNPDNSRMSGNMRIAIFDTPSFDSRIYAFENDMLFNYTMSAYQQKGIRYYLNLKYRLNRATDFWLKYANSNYIDSESVGSGLDEIEGDKRSDLKLQLRFRF